VCSSDLTRSDGSADVFGLARFLRDDDLISHDGSFERIDFGRGIRTYSEQGRPRKLPFVSKFGPPKCCTAL
jgi:hypothetical protein